MKVSKLFKAFRRYLTDPEYRMHLNSRWGFYDRMPDEEYLKHKYRVCMGKELDLENPQTYNEKLQWLKLNNRHPKYTMMADKYRVRQYIAETLGEEYLIPLLGVWDRAEDIDFDKLPEQFVLKCNHNSGLGMCICRDKRELDVEKARSGLARGLKQDYYLRGREWPYKNIPRKIIAEQFMVDPAQPNGINDYKFMCFNGEPKCVFVCRNRSAGLNITVFDMDWERLHFGRRSHPAETCEICKPVNFERMIEFARRLSKNTAFLRVDFYEVEGKIYFGELTFFPASGLELFEPEEWDLRLGQWLDISAIDQ